MCVRDPDRIDGIGVDEEEEDEEDVEEVEVERALEDVRAAASSCCVHIV